MAVVAEEFPVVTRDTTGGAALLARVRSFCRTYEAHAVVIWIITRTELEDVAIYSPGLQLFFRLSEIMAERMTAAADRDDRVAAPPDGESAKGNISAHAELTALLCLLMLEGVSTLMNADVQLPRDSMAERISAIIYAAFAIPQPGVGQGQVAVRVAGQRYQRVWHGIGIAAGLASNAVGSTSVSGHVQVVRPS